jgi:hypothetical protein
VKGCIEIAEDLAKRILRRTFDCPTFRLQKQDKFVPDREDPVSLAPPLPARGWIVNDPLPTGHSHRFTALWICFLVFFQ